MSITGKYNRGGGAQFTEENIPDNAVFVCGQSDSTIWVKLGPGRYATFFINAHNGSVQTGYLEFGSTSKFTNYREVDLVLEVHK